MIVRAVLAARVSGSNTTLGLNKILQIFSPTFSLLIPPQTSGPPIDAPSGLGPPGGGGGPGFPWKAPGGGGAPPLGRALKVPLPLCWTSPALWLCPPMLESKFTLLFRGLVPLCPCALRAMPPRECLPLGVKFPAPLVLPALGVGCPIIPPPRLPFRGGGGAGPPAPAPIGVPAPIPACCACSNRLKFLRRPDSFLLTLLPIITPSIPQRTELWPPRGYPFGHISTHNGPPNKPLESFSVALQERSGPSQPSPRVNLICVRHRDFYVVC